MYTTVLIINDYRTTASLSARIRNVKWNEPADIYLITFLWKHITGSADVVTGTANARRLIQTNHSVMYF